MAAPKIPISEERLLLVEGKDELNLFSQMINTCFQSKPGIQILDIGGKTTLGQNLMTIGIAVLSRPSFRSMGIVRDSDASASDSFTSVCASVSHAGFTPPAVHATFSNASPSIGVFIVPDGQQPGAIETICRNSVQGNQAVTCVDDYINCLKTRDALQSSNEDKTFTHAYLAAARDPVARVGEGARQGAWDFQSPAFAELRQFIQDLASQ